MNRILASAIALTIPMIDRCGQWADIRCQAAVDEVKTLSSDAFEGRGPATAGETKTIDYVVGQMKEAGLKPGGDLKDGKRLWTQAVPLLRAEIVGTPSSVDRWTAKPKR